MELDPAIAKLLNLDPAQTTVTPIGGGDSSALTARISSTLADGTVKRYFLKTGVGEFGQLMVRGS